LRRDGNGMVRQCLTIDVYIFIEQGVLMLIY
jgi:hypothetical protein